MSDNNDAFLKDLQNQCLTDSKEYLDGYVEALSDFQSDMLKALAKIAKHIHSLKGNVQAAGFLDLGRFLHDFESALTAVEAGIKSGEHVLSDENKNAFEFFLSDVQYYMQDYIQELGKNLTDAPQLYEDRKACLDNLNQWWTSISSIDLSKYDDEDENSDEAEGRSNEGEIYDGLEINVAAKVDGPSVMDKAQSFIDSVVAPAADAMSAEILKPQEVVEQEQPAIDVSEIVAEAATAAPVSEQKNADITEGLDLSLMNPTSQPSPVHQKISDRLAAQPQVEPILKIVPNPENIEEKAPSAMVVKKISEGPKHYLLCKAGRNHYGVTVDSVVEVVSKMSLNLLPYNRKDIRGLVNLRGETISILNLDWVFGQVQNARYIVVCSLNGRSFGFEVDEAEQVLVMDKDKFQEIPNSLAIGSASNKAVTHIAQVNDMHVLILNLMEVSAA